MRPKVIIYDSGVGGLSVYQEVHELLPNCEYICFADQEHFPYGDKTDAEVTRIVMEQAGKLIQKYSPQVFVIACNTASAAALEALRAHYAIPFVGVVPALKPAALQTKTKVIGLLATPATARSRYIDRLVEEHCQDVEVVRVGSSRLALIAEEKIAGKKVEMDKIREEMKPLIERKDLDTVVLGCTHFPLLKEDFNRVFGRSINWIDSGSAIAKRVAALI